MAQQCTAYRDAKGNLHTDPERATVADLALILGRIGGEESGLSAGIARAILDNRAAIEKVFAEHDKIAPKIKAVRAA